MGQPFNLSRLGQLDKPVSLLDGRADAQVAQPQHVRVPQRVTQNIVPEWTPTVKK
jgi:hypothetical protein